MVAHRTDVVLRLPDAAALDARSRMQGVDDAPPEDVFCNRGRVNEEAARRAGNLRLVGRRLAEEELEARPCGAKVGRRGHREVELECVREQEHAVDGRPNLEVGEPDGGQLSAERARPVLENVRDRNAVGDPEREVQVGEAIAASDRQRAHSCPRDDALVLVGKLEHPRTQRVSLLDREHR